MRYLRIMTTMVNGKVVSAMLQIREGKGRWEDVRPLKVLEKHKEPMDKREQIETAFTYHAPKPGQPERYSRLRDKAKEFALLIAELTPVSREQSLALTELEKAVMFANATIARNE